MKGLLFSWVLLSLNAHAQAAPDVLELLGRADAALFNAKTVRLAGTHAQDISTGSVATNFAPNPERVVRSFTLEREISGKAREEIREGNDTTLMVFDGSMAWTYRSANSSYSSRPATNIPTASSGFQNLEYGRNPLNIISASARGEESVAFGGKSTPCMIVAATYKRVPGVENIPGLRYIARRVWISHDRNLVLRDRWEFESVFSGIVTRISNLYEYSTIEWGIPLTGDLFTFRPPAGSVVVEWPPKLRQELRLIFH
jgi:outer membrane lipoprotein-sorting protein